MKTFNGISGSPGIAIGTIFLYLDENLKVPKYYIKKEDIKTEIDRFENAVECSLKEIRELQNNNSNNSEEQRFLDSHILMLQDPEFLSKIKKSIEEQKHNAEWVLFKTIKQYISTLEAHKDPYLRERIIDIHDVAERVYNHLLSRDKISLADLTQDVIIVTHNLLPSDTIAMNKSAVKGIAMNAGGKTSHTAILARAFEIPAVLGLSNITNYAKSGDEIIIDGNSGLVLLHPDIRTKKHYQELQKEWRKHEIELLNLNELKSETKDGKRIYLKGNIELPEEVDSVLSHGSDGIGLFRSEFLFLQPGSFASEEEQFQAYSQVLKSMEKPVTIRTLDVGGDKIVPGMDSRDEKNPLLGWRAIRFCLSEPYIFRTQLRALLRASIYGDLRIMIPMISGVEELEHTLYFYENVKNELLHENINIKKDIPMGIMIEVPSAALTADILAQYVDFFSIGTNDLIQYTVAVDRGNEKIAYLYEPFHPGVLRLIRMVIDSGHKAGIPVGMCGEMAGDPLSTVVLLGLGLDEYSMSAFSIPEIKKIIRSVSVAEAEELVGKIIEMKSHRDIDRYTKDWMNERFNFNTK